MEIMHSQKYLQQRRFFTVLPLIILPFVTLVFWLLGGGSEAAIEKETKGGLNLALPDARLKAEGTLDKLSFYNAADADSVKHSLELRSDPSWKDTSIAYQVKKYTINSVPDNRERISQKVLLLKKGLEYDAVPNNQPETPFTGDIERLQNMMQRMTAPKKDDEMDALNVTLEKILEIQHPERTKNKSVQQRTNAFVVSTLQKNTDNTLFGSRDSLKASGVFYDETIQNPSGESNVIRAVVHGTQTLQTGARIKFRLLTDIYVAGTHVPPGIFIYGIGTLENERLSIHISSILFENNLLPVSLSVHYLDGLKGIYVPGSIERDVAKQSADQALQSIGILSIDPSLKAQATAAGIGAAKSLLSKKVKQISVTVKSGDQVILKDDNSQNQ